MTRLTSTTRYRPRRLAAVAFGTAAALALAACSGAGSTPDTQSASSTPQSGGTLDIAFWPDNAAFPCIDPFQTYWIESRTIIRNYADSLTDQDPKTGEIVPWLAKSWKVNKAGTQYTFHLRDDVTFSDGTTFTADSVKTAFDNDAAVLKDNPAAYGGIYLSNYASTTVKNPTTVTVNFSKPNASFLQATSTTNLAILAASSYMKTAAERCLGTGIVGSGPFTLKSYKPNVSLALAKRPGYSWGSSLRQHTGGAYLDGINVSYVAEDSVRLGQLTSGSVDIDWPRNGFTENDETQITAAGDTLESRSLPGPAANYYPNTSAGHPLADEKVREAVQKAINRKSYASTVFGAKYPVVSSLFDTTTPYYTDESSKLAFDEAGATKLLDEAGWKTGSNGYRSKDGKELTLTIPIQASNPGDELVQAQLKKVGINVKLAVFTPAQRAGILSAGNYDLISTYYTRADPGVIQWIVDPRYAGSQAQAENNFTPEQTKKVESLLDEGTATVDATARAKIYAELQDYLIDNALIFPTYERVQKAGISSDVHGFRFTSEAFGDFADTWISQ